MQAKFISFDSIETCPICTEPYQDTSQKQPRLIPCGHSVCTNCVLKWVKENQSFTCPECFDVFTKGECVDFKVNHYYIKMIQSLKSHFGNCFQILTKQPLINFNQTGISNYQPEAIGNNNNMVNGSQNFDEIVKCKNSACFNPTELIFCSEKCRVHFEQVETNKNEGKAIKKRNSH